MKIKHLLPMLAVAALLSTTSCIKDSDEVIKQTLTFSEYFNAVSDIKTGVTDVTPAPKYTVELTQTGSKLTAVIKLSNFFLPDIKASEFTLPELSVQYLSDGTMSIKAQDVAPTNASTSETVNFNNVEVKILQVVIQSIGGTTTVVTNFSSRIQVNNQWLVVAYPNVATFFASTESRNLTDGSVFQTYEPLYAISFSGKDMNATIDITGAQFMSQMPAMNMSFPKIPMTISQSGIVLETEALVPTIEDVPYPGYPITDLKCTYTPMSNSTLSFFCEPGQLGTFAVTATMNENPTVFDK